MSETLNDQQSETAGAEGRPARAGSTARSPADYEAELEAMAMVYKALAGLPRDGRERCLTWIADVFDIGPDDRRAP